MLSGGARVGVIGVALGLGVGCSSRPSDEELERLRTEAVAANEAARSAAQLATPSSGAPIPRSSGGPIFLVHPFSENGPELRTKSPDRFWSFYVTHFIVGTEQPRLVIKSRMRVGARVAAASRGEPAVTREAREAAEPARDARPPVVDFATTAARPPVVGFATTRGLRPPRSVVLASRRPDRGPLATRPS